MEDKKIDFERILKENELYEKQKYENAKHLYYICCECSYFSYKITILKYNVEKVYKDKITFKNENNCLIEIEESDIDSDSHRANIIDAGKYTYIRMYHFTVFGNELKFIVDQVTDKFASELKILLLKHRREELFKIVRNAVNNKPKIIYQNAYI